jgi:hypothetical protein
MGGAVFLICQIFSLNNKCFQRRALCRDDRKSPIPLQLLQKEESTGTRKAIVLTSIQGFFMRFFQKLFFKASLAPREKAYENDVSIHTRHVLIVSVWSPIPGSTIHIYSG